MNRNLKKEKQKNSNNLFVVLPRCVTNIVIKNPIRPTNLGLI